MLGQATAPRPPYTLTRQVAGNGGQNYSSGGPAPAIGKGSGSTQAADCWPPAAGVKCRLRSRVPCASRGNGVRADEAVTLPRRFRPFENSREEGCTHGQK
jgi:hypothetical protein